MLDPPLSPAELAVLNAALAGGRTLGEINAAVGESASATLRGLEHREPPLVEKDVDAGLGERVWKATVAGMDARDEAEG